MQESRFYFEIRHQKVEMHHSVDTKKTVESNEKARKDTRKGEWRIVFYKCEELCGNTFFL